MCTLTHRWTRQMVMGMYITHTYKLLITCCVRYVLCPMQIHSAEAAAQPRGANPRQEVSLSDSSFSPPLPPLCSFDQCVASSAFSRYYQHVYASVYTHSLCVCVHLLEYVTPPLCRYNTPFLFSPRLFSSAVKVVPLCLPLCFPLSGKSPLLLFCACVCMCW